MDAAIILVWIAAIVLCGCLALLLARYKYRRTITGSSQSDNFHGTPGDASGANDAHPRVDLIDDEFDLNENIKLNSGILNTISLLEQRISSELQTLESPPSETIYAKMLESYYTGSQDTDDSLMAEMLGAVGVAEISQSDERTGSSPVESPEEAKSTYARNVIKQAIKEHVEKIETVHPPIITLNDIRRDKFPDYKPGFGGKSGHHNGQRKLNMVEWLFLTDAVRESGGRNANITVVYAGAAPANHTGYMAHMFPNIKFILVDPNNFAIHGVRSTILWNETEHNYKAQQMLDRNMRRGDESIDDRADDVFAAAAALPPRPADPQLANIYIVNSYFTVGCANAVARHFPGRVYFISDIRTNSHQDEQAPDTLDITWNMAQQYNWIRAMKPIASHLKFRPPFYNEAPTEFLRMAQLEPYATDYKLALQGENPIDFVGNALKGIMVYFKGTVFIQPWQPRSSTETRLVVRDLDIMSWGNSMEHDSRMAYYNIVQRMLIKHENIANDRDAPNECDPRMKPFPLLAKWTDRNNINLSGVCRPLGLDMCNDCSIEVYTWKKYLELYAPEVRGLTTQIRYCVLALSQILHRTLLKPPVPEEGFLFGHGHFFGVYDNIDDLVDNRGVPRSLINKKRNAQGYNTWVKNSGKPNLTK